MGLAVQGHIAQTKAINTLEFNDVLLVYPTSYI